MTNEQKLEEIYRIIKAQESRRQMSQWVRIFKWGVIMVFVYIVATHPEAVSQRVTEVLKPIILSTASGMIESQKEQLQNSLKGMLPEWIELQ